MTCEDGRIRILRGRFYVLMFLRTIHADAYAAMGIPFMRRHALPFPTTRTPSRVPARRDLDRANRFRASVSLGRCCNQMVV